MTETAKIGHFTCIIFLDQPCQEDPASEIISSEVRLFMSVDVYVVVN